MKSLLLCKTLGYIHIVQHVSDHQLDQVEFSYRFA